MVAIQKGYTMKLLFSALLILVPVCTGVTIVVLQACTERIVNAIRSIPLGPLPVANTSVTGRGAPTAADIIAAKERANFKQPPP
jgi:hypothetical protein